MKTIAPATATAPGPPSTPGFAIGAIAGGVDPAPPAGATTAAGGAGFAVGATAGGAAPAPAAAAADGFAFGASAAAPAPASAPSALGTPGFAFGSAAPAVPAPVPATAAPSATATPGLAFGGGVTPAPVPAVAGGFGFGANAGGVTTENIAVAEALLRIPAPLPTIASSALLP